MLTALAIELIFFRSKSHIPNCLYACHIISKRLPVAAVAARAVSLGASAGAAAGLEYEAAGRAAPAAAGAACPIAGCAAVAALAAAGPPAAAAGLSAKALHNFTLNILQLDCSMFHVCLILG